MGTTARRVVVCVWIAVGCMFPGVFPSAAAGDDPRGEPLPRDPYDARRLENDVLGVRVWGPPTQPTLSLGKSDIWDRRWFAARQPLITLAKSDSVSKRRLAFARLRDRDAQGCFFIKKRKARVEGR